MAAPRADGAADHEHGPACLHVIERLERLDGQLVGRQRRRLSFMSRAVTSASWSSTRRRRKPARDCDSAVECLTERRFARDSRNAISLVAVPMIQASPLAFVFLAAVVSRTKPLAQILDRPAPDPTTVVLDIVVPRLINEKVLLHEARLALLDCPSVNAKDPVDGCHPRRVLGEADDYYGHEYEALRALMFHHDALNPLL